MTSEEEKIYLNNIIDSLNEELLQLHAAITLNEAAIKRNQEKSKLLEAEIERLLKENEELKKLPGL